MKIKKEDVGREEIWRVADVKSIPLGWTREVWYDTVDEELFAVLVSRGTEIRFYEGCVFLGKFVSLAEWYANCSLGAGDILGEGAKEEDLTEEDLLSAYQVLWWEEYDFPPEW